MVRWWLIFIIILQPVHERIITYFASVNNYVARAISVSDEITLIVCFLLAIREYRVNKYPFRIHLLYFIPMLVLILSGGISGIINGNSLLGTSHALFLYVRSFFFIFIFSAFFREKGDFRKLYRPIIVLGIFLAAIAVFQELWALTSKYFLGTRNMNSIFYYDLAALHEKWRLGLFRVSSLMSHYNLYGIYMVLLITIYLSFSKKMNYKVLFLFSTSILLSLSRAIYVGFAVVLIHQILKKRRWMIPLLVPIVLLGVIELTPYYDFDLTGIQRNSNGITYREYAQEKAMEIWGDHPYWGVGPGMFGWGIATKYKSHIEEEYNFRSPMGSSYLDQYWPQLMAELGLIGTIAYASLLFWVFMLLFTSGRQSSSKGDETLFLGLAIFIVVLIPYSLGNNLIIAPVLHTYFAFTGIALGSIDRSSLFN